MSLVFAVVFCVLPLLLLASDLVFGGRGRRKAARAAVVAPPAGQRMVHRPAR